MIVTLIPLFLAANISVNEVDWKYGPEIIWNVQVNAMAKPPDYKLQVGTMNSTLKLNCRLETKLVLNCRFREIRYATAVLNPGKGWSTKDSKDFGDEGPGEDAFQLHFCPDGFNYIVVSSPFDPSRLDMIRTLAGQLNVGANLSEVNRRNFNAVEKSSAGLCNAIFHLSTDKDTNGNSVDNDENNRYELVNVVGSNYSTFGELEKSRILDDCLYRTNYVYGNHETEPSPSIILEKTLISSRSKMTTTKSKFTSYTENVASMTDKNKPGDKMIVEEVIILNLADIVPAMGPIPKINNATRVRIYPTTSLRDDTSESMINSESS